MRTESPDCGTVLLNASLIAATLAAATPAEAQLSVALTGGRVRYENVATTNSVAVGPDLLVIRPRLLFDVNGAASSSTDGTRLAQGNAMLWGATPSFAGHLQFTGLLQAQGTRPEGLAASSMVLGFGEVAVTGTGGGLAGGAGGVSGQLEGQPSVNALRTGARAWISNAVASVAVAVQPTRLDGSWFTDFGGRVQVNRASYILLGGVTVRQGSGLATSTGVDGVLIWRPHGPMSFEATGGRYLRDPYQALPAGWYMTAGLRLTLWKPAAGSLNSNVGQASLSTLGIAGQTATSSSTRSVPAVTKTATGSGASTSGGGIGRGHRP
jgi:hypothetical protein